MIGARPGLRFMGWLLTLTMVVVGLLACGAPSDSGGNESQPAPVMAVSAARVRLAPMSRVLTLLGVTAAMRHTVLRAPSAGMVIDLHLENGDTVHPGEIVARVISQEDIAAQAGLAIARKLQPGAAADLARSVREYAHSPGVPVVATQAAVVAQRMVSSGQTVAYLDPLVDLVDPASMYVVAAVPIGQAYLLRVGMKAAITTALSPGVTYPGRVAAILPNSSPNPATSSCRIDFTGTHPIRIAGVATQVAVIADYVRQAVVIPKAALFQDASTQTYYVFTVDRDSIAHRTAVVPGIRNDDLVEITRGLHPGDVVITSGGYALSDGLKVVAAIQPAPSGGASPMAAGVGQQ